MSKQIWYELLEGEGQGQRVRVLIEVEEQGDTSELGNLTRREICNGIASEVGASARAFGVELRAIETNADRCETPILGASA